MHQLIVGTTGTGKTTMGTQLARAHARRGVYSIVLDPIGDRRWPTELRIGDRPACYVTDDKREFAKWVASSQRCMVFVDESGEMIGQYSAEMFWVATRARHFGHLSHFLTQRPSQISPTVRGQCSDAFVFGVSLDDAQLLAKSWARTPEEKAAILSSGTLAPGEYIHLRRLSPPQRGRIELGG